MKKETILVTSALPYANGPIHFGHIAGAYLPADIFVRFKRLCGADVVYICGTDEHGFAITVSAQEEGNTPQQHVDKYYGVIRDIFEKFNIRFDNFSRTTKPEHYKLSQDFFTNLVKNGHIEAKETEQLYAESLGLFLADRYVIGTCPQCGYEEARGDECPSCGAWLEALELKNPRCKINGETPVVRTTKHWFLKLGDFQDRLKEWMDGKTGWKPNVTQFIKKMIDRGLESRPITRDMPWGVPVPLKEADGKVLYVWFDAPIGYVSSTVEWAKAQGKPDLWKHYWQNPDCRVVHFIGKDNLPFHCVVWPAMLMGQKGEWNLPTDVPANEFYNLEGKQFSKSTGWYINLDTFFQSYPTDSIRYAIAVNAPETKDSAFSWKDFQNRHNGELADTLGNFVNRTLKFASATFEHKIPAPRKTGEQEERLQKLVGEAFKNIEHYYNTYQVRKACYELMELARSANRYFDEKAPWKSKKENPEECAATIHCALSLIKALAQMAYPILPETAEKIWKMLGNTEPVSNCNWEAEKHRAPEAGKNLGQAEILFTKIEDAQIEREMEKLEQLNLSKDKESRKTGEGKQTPAQVTGDEAAAPAAEAKKTPPTGKDNLLTIDQVLNVKLKVAEVLEAEDIPKSKKLVKLQIALGPEKRQIVAGIKEYYPDVASLVGRQIVVVSNLKPAKLMGHESQGMLLAAKDGKQLRLIGPDGPVDSGAEVS